MVKRNIASLEQIKSALPESLRELCGKKLSAAYSLELECLEEYSASLKEGQIYLGMPESSGSQWTCFFEVVDRSLPRTDSFNWHLQNTSQWRYAGCIAIDKRSGDVSRHH
ncbi:MAG: hypothetical protein NTV33_10945 [Coprothermobacterota bacterium]|nr:hypothetical protein [Coprothermobacterota bacterium]